MKYYNLTGILNVKYSIIHNFGTKTDTDKHTHKHTHTNKHTYTFICLINYPISYHNVALGVYAVERNTESAFRITATTR